MQVHVRKQGNVATVFMSEPGSGYPLPIHTFEEEPQGYPETMSIAEVESRFAGNEIIYITPPQTRTNETTQAEYLQLTKEAETFVKDFKQPVTSQPTQTPSPPADNSIAAILKQEKATYELAATYATPRAKKELQVILNYIEQLGSKVGIW